MESTPGNVLNLGKCMSHSSEICCICVNPTCKKNLLCYQCVFAEHSKHIEQCIPLNLWKFQNSDGTDAKLDNLLEKIDKASTEIKDLADLIQNYFSRIFERLYVLKEKCAAGKTEPSLIFRNFPVNENFSVKDGFYVVDSSNLGNMVDNLNFSLFEEIETYLIDEFNKLKLNNKSSVPVKKSPVRFSSVNGNWSHSTSYWDCVGFKSVEEGIILIGVGCYKPDNATQEYSCKIKIFEDELKDEKAIFDKDYDLSTLTYGSDGFGDIMFGKNIVMKKDRVYIIAKLNLKANSNGNYGKNQTNNSVKPFEFISYKGTSDSYKSGNYTDLTCGDFPYFLYR